ncbi:MAG TPA: carboxypeptidase regulatory-like domain-containing protein [Planctomycetes bacterium]|nr:carboxypeptidase regulatory-like domain-containing protein [Planctomycetota bacterium]
MTPTLPRTLAALLFLALPCLGQVSRAPAAASGSALALTVRVAETGEALPWVQGWFLDLDVWYRFGRYTPEPNRPWNLEILLRRFGHPVRADAAGVMPLPHFARRGLVAAVDGERWGLRLVDAKMESPPTLELAPPAVVRCRVVDAQGRRLRGFPVQLIHQTASPLPPWAVWQSLTLGEDREAVFNRIPPPEMLIALLDAGAGEVGTGLTAQVPGVFAQPVRAPVTPSPADRHLTVLKVPEMAQIMVDLRKTDGSPYTGMSRIWLEDEGHRWPTPGYLTMTGRMLIQVPADGRWLTVHAETVDFVMEPVWSLLRLPDRAGTRRGVTLFFDLKQTLMTGNLRNTRGDPVAFRRMEAVFRGEGEDGPIEVVEERFRSDRKGRFRLAVPPIATGVGNLEVVLRPIDVWRNHREEALIRAGLIWPTETLALGSVSLAERPVAAEGRVGDATGRPLSGVLVVLVRQNPDGEEVLAVTCSDPWGRFVLRTSSPDGRTTVRLVGAPDARILPVSDSR